MEQLHIWTYVDFTYLGNDEREFDTFLVSSTQYPVAAICIQPQFVGKAKKHTKLPIATVCNFPYGTDSIDDSLASIAKVIDSGINEIDIVFPFKDYLAGEKTLAFNKIQALLEAIPRNIIKKVIIESCVYQNDSDIRAICQTLISMKVDFIKTSTGKKKGADIHRSRIILETIKHYSLNQHTGFKASGGIRTLKDACEYLTLAQTILDISLSPARFRIGSSGLTG